MPAVVMPMQIIRPGGNMTRRTTICVMMSATPTVVSAMPAACAPSPGVMPNRSMAKKPTTICPTATVNSAVKAATIGRRNLGSSRRGDCPGRAPTGGVVGRNFHSTASPSAGNSAVR